jgi:hypothetical protein
LILAGSPLIWVVIILAFFSIAGLFVSYVVSYRFDRIFVGSIFLDYHIHHIRSNDTR